MKPKKEGQSGLIRTLPMYHKWRAYGPSQIELPRIGQTLPKPSKGTRDSRGARGQRDGEALPHA